MMSRAPVYFLSLAALAMTARGQAVISTRSGVVHFFEGAVSVAGQPLEPRLGRFTSIPEGAELRTGQGRAEVLLNPGVFLRVGEKSAIRMLSDSLSDTRVELLAGSAIVDSMEPAAGTSANLIYKGWNIHQAQKGVYRVDCEPPRLRVDAGEVQVSTASGAPVAVQQGMEMPFAEVLVPEKASGQSHDALGDWAAGRAESVSADNAIAAGIQDPISLNGPDLPLDGFTYFPMIGLTSVGSTLPGSYGSSSPYPPGTYGTLSPFQPGFYSIYLPGYTYRPLLLGLPSGRLPGSYPSYRGGTSRLPAPGSPIGHPVTPHPVPRGGAHAGAHR